MLRQSFRAGYPEGRAVQNARIYPKLLVRARIRVREVRQHLQIAKRRRRPARASPHDVSDRNWRVAAKEPIAAARHANVYKIATIRAMIVVKTPRGSDAFRALRYSWRT